MINGKKIILGVTGSIAAYKAAELARLLIKAGAQVKVVMSKSAQAFIAPLTFQALTNQPVYSELLTPTESAMEHISLAKWADLILIAPASASLMAKLAHGLADDLLTTLCLATTAPIILAPAMNQQMWRNSITQENLQKLMQHRYQFIGPAAGDQACGDCGPGRMEEPEQILNYLSQDNKLVGLKVLITAGPTQEPIDPVRYISNHSSGKMGYALAQVLIDQGAIVTMVSGPTHLAVPQQTKLIAVKTAAEMQAAVDQEISNCDVFIAAAAVADYRVESIALDKIKKQQTEWQLHLVKTPDILKSVAMLENPPFLVGFAAETNNVLENAYSKLTQKNLDLLIVNQIDKDSGAPFYSDLNKVSILQPGKAAIELPQMSKLQLAKSLIELIWQAYQIKK